MESDLQQCIATFGSAFLSTTSTSFWTHQGMSTLKRRNPCKRRQWAIERDSLVFVAWLWFHSRILFLSYSFSSALDASLHPWRRQLCARSLLSCWLIAINKNSKQPSRNRQRTHGSGDRAIVQRRIPLRSYDFDEWCTFCDLCGSKIWSNDAWNILRKHSRNDLLDAIRQHQCCAVLAGDSLKQKMLVFELQKVWQFAMQVLTTDTSICDDSSSTSSSTHISSFIGRSRHGHACVLFNQLEQNC